MEKDTKKIKPSLNLLIDFCNIKLWDVKALLELHKTHEIGYVSGDFGKGPWSIHCRARLDKSRCFCLTEDDNSRARHEEFPDSYILPSQPQFNELFELLKVSQNRYKKFLNKMMIKMDLDESFIQGTINVFENVKWSCIKTNNKWKPIVDYQPHPNFSNLETYIDLEIANIIVKERGNEIFPYIKKCEWCINYYPANTLNKNQRFCSDKCRQDWHNRKRIESGEHARYKRER